MAAFTTIAAVLGAVAALGTAGAQVAAGQQASKNQRRGRWEQAVAQTRAQGEAASQQRAQQREQAAANRDEPNLALLIAQAQEGSAGGSSGTFLSGRGQGDTGQIGRSTLLGL